MTFRGIFFIKWTFGQNSPIDNLCGNCGHLTTQTKHLATLFNNPRLSPARNLLASTCNHSSNQHLNIFYDTIQLFLPRMRKRREQAWFRTRTAGLEGSIYNAKTPVTIFWPIGLVSKYQFECLLIVFKLGIVLQSTSIQLFQPTCFSTLQSLKNRI